MADLDLNKIELSDKPKDYPNVQNANMEKIQTGVDNIDTSIDDHETRIDANETALANIDNTYATDADLTSLSGNLQGQITTNTNALANIDNTYASDADLTSLSGNLQGQISNIDARVSINEINIGSISGNLETLQIQVDAISGGNSNVDLTNVTTDILPSISGAYDIGSPALPFKDLYLTQNSMYLGSNKVSIENDRLNVNSKVLAELEEVIAISGNLSVQIADVQTQLDNAVISGGGSVIGEGRDGDYVGGLFPFEPTTPIGHAIDDMNVFMSSFSPPLPSSLGSMSSNSGETGKLSYDNGNIPATYNDHGDAINSTFNTSGTKKGIFNDSTTLTGTLANDVSAHAFSYPANAFNEGNVGTLALWVNGVSVHSIDLTSFVSGSDVNGNGSGFNLSVATAVQFESGQELDAFQYRTGTWTVDSSELINGYNTIKVIHTTGSSNETQEFEYFVDAETDSVVLVTHTIDNLNMGTVEYLSGVKYHPNGTFDYNFNVDDSYNVTHSTSNITFSTGNSSISALAIPDAVDPTDAIDTTVTGTIASSRLFDADVSVQMTVPKTLSRGTTIASISNFNLLVDPNINNLSGTSNTKDTMNTETYRIAEELFDDQTNLRNVSYGSGGTSPFPYVSTVNIYSTAGYTSSLMQYNGKVVYPSSSQVVNSGAFNSITNGPTSNVNYTLTSGNRVYMRLFYFSGTYKNFSLKITETNTNYVTVATGPSGNNVTVEALLPNGTTDTNGTDNLVGNVEFKDCSVPFSTLVEGGAGCEWAGNKQGGHDFGINFGRRSTFMSGGAVIIRITASDAWAGSIDEIELVTV